jgi:hypothetical protein
MTEKNRIVYETLMKVKNFTKGVSKVQAGFKKLSNLASAFATGFMGSQLLTMFQDWAKEAGKVETVNRSFSRSFGVMASETEASLIKMSTILKRNTSEMKKGAVSFQAFFTGLGFASKASSQMSVDLQKMSVDLASFFGIADANAQKRFLAALAGSPEVLDQFGINLKQAALQVELYNMGIKTTVQNTSETVKTTARLAIIMRSMSSAGILGDAFRSMDTYAGKVKALDSQFLEFQQNMGNVVIPVLIKGMETLSGLFTIIDNILKLRDLSDFLAGNAIEAAEIRKYREELEKIKETQTILNFLAENNTRFRNADKVLNDEEYALFVSLVTKEKELKKLLEEGNLERTDEVELKKEHLYYSNEIQKFQVRINEQIKEQVKQQEELNRLKQIEADGFTSEIEAIKEKFDTQKRHQKLFEKDSSELETQKQLQQELLVIYGKQLKAGVLTTEEYKKQTDELLAINTALMTVNTTEFRSIERERRRKATKDFDFVGAGDKIGSLNQRNLDLLGTSVISDQSAAMADALLDKDKFINRIKNTLSNIKISLIDVLKGSFQEDMRMMQISLEQIAMPFINASMQLFDQMLTPPDATLSKEEQAEKTKGAFAGIIVGLGQAMMAIGQGMVLTAIGLETLKKEPIVGGAIGVAMIGIGAGLVKSGKGKLQNLKNSAHARDAGGTANSGSGVGGFGSMMNAIQGEQVFRLAGNDLVTAINRTNTFQGSIGG